MKSPFIWIIDEEWPDYEVETKILQEKYPDCTIKYSTYDNYKELTSFGYKVDAIMCQVYASITENMIEKLPNCKAIAIYGGGYDRVDIQAAKKQNIKVTNVSNYCKEDIADYVITSICHFNKQILGYTHSIKQELWGAQAVSQPIHRLSTNTLFIIGLGRIGRTVAARAQHMQMKVIAYDPYVDKRIMEDCGVEKVSLEEGLKRADFVSIHAIYNTETEGLLGRTEFSMMKKTAYIINTARGKIICEKDLIAAVKGKIISGAMLDVIANEPPAGEEEILHCPHITVTPHISYISQESYTELKIRTAGNLIQMLEGEIPEDWVNP